ncbi:hypothetical protein Tco_0637017 [Tanacetum coccineum]
MAQGMAHVKVRKQGPLPIIMGILKLSMKYECSAGFKDVWKLTHIKLDKMDGRNFTRWKEKTKFLLTAFKVYYVLEGPPIGVMTEEEERKREQDETLCRGYILSTLTDRTFV